MANLDLRVIGRYRLRRRLGSGSFGAVYEGVDLQTEQEVAVKLECVRTYPSALKNETSIYEELAGPGIPRIYWHGCECEFRVMVFELLGPNLEDLFNYCGRKFSLKTVLMLADQLIRRFQFIHSKGFIHSDIKPENLLMGDGAQGNTAYVADIGLAMEFSDTGRGSEAQRSTICLVGTARYASINGHSGQEQCPRDDLESLGYVLIYFIHGSLPWQGLKYNTEEQKERLILEKKESTSPEELCRGLPKEFQTYFEHVRALRFNETPGYAYLLRLFRNLFHRKGYEYDRVFDWTELKFLDYLKTSRKLSGDG